MWPWGAPSMRGCTNCRAATTTAAPSTKTWTYSTARSTASPSRRRRLCARLNGGETLEINSLHWQAIDRVAEGLQAEGLAEDGTIEAVSVKGAARISRLGVQWHPEYKSWENPFSQALFAAFGEAARRHQ